MKEKDVLKLQVQPRESMAIKKEWLRCRRRGADLTRRGLRRELEAIDLEPDEWTAADSAAIASFCNEEAKRWLELAEEALLISARNTESVTDG